MGPRYPATCAAEPPRRSASHGVCMSANAYCRTIIDTAKPSAECQRAEPSLPSAGFRVYRACDPHSAIGMFTTHRADPSWT